MAEMTKDMYGAAGRVGRKSWQQEFASDRFNFVSDSGGDDEPNEN